MKRYTSGGVGTLSQFIPTTPGTEYLISFWLDNPIGGLPSSTRLSWNSQVLMAAENLPPFGWTNEQFTAVAAGDSTLLQFSFEQDYDYFGLDDIVVIPIAEGPPPLVIQNTALAGQSFEFTWSTVPSTRYQVQYKANLNQPTWSNLGPPVTASGAALTASDLVTNIQRFYRIVLTN